MIILKIKDKGHFINIPGLPPLRTPVNIKADRVDLRLAEIALRKANIKNYEIVSVEEVHEPKKEEISYVEIPVKEDPDNKISKLESMVELLLSREIEKTTGNREQINEKLERFEKILLERTNRQSIEVYTNGDPIIEELEEMYIPEVDIEGMKIKGDTTKEVFKQDEDFNENADLLADLLINKGEM